MWNLGNVSIYAHEICDNLINMLLHFFCVWHFIISFTFKCLLWNSLISSTFNCLLLCFIISSTLNYLLWHLIISSTSKYWLWHLWFHSSEVILLSYHPYLTAHVTYSKWHLTLNLFYNIIQIKLFFVTIWRSNVALYHLMMIFSSTFHCLLWHLAIGLWHWNWEEMQLCGLWVQTLEKAPE